MNDKGENMKKARHGSVRRFALLALGALALGLLGAATAPRGDALFAPAACTQQGAATLDGMHAVPWRATAATVDAHGSRGGAPRSVAVGGVLRAGPTPALARRL